MQRFSRLTILAFFFAAFISQAQTSRCAAAYDNLVADRNVELNLSGAGADLDVTSTNTRTGRIMAGFEFLGRIDKRVIKEFDKAWQISGNGTCGREGVVLIFRMGDGSYTGKSPGFSNEYRRFTFRWDPAAVAIVHTHPNSCDPKPSPQDERVADKYEVPIFTLTLSGMYVYNPTTRMTSKVVNGLDWLKLSTWQEANAKLQGCGAQSFEDCY